MIEYRIPQHPVVEVLEDDMGNGMAIYNSLVSKALLKTGNVHDAEDIASEVITKVIENPWNYRDMIDWTNPSADKQFMGWLNKVLRSCVVDHYRMVSALKRGTRREVSLDAWEEPPKEAAYESDIGQGQELGELLKEAISRLDSKYSTVANLIYFGGLSYGDTATILHIPVGTVKSRMHKAKKAIQRAIPLELRVA